MSYLFIPHSPSKARAESTVLYQASRPKQQAKRLKLHIGTELPDFILGHEQMTALESSLSCSVLLSFPE